MPRMRSACRASISNEAAPDDRARRNGNAIPAREHALDAHDPAGGGLLPPASAATAAGSTEQPAFGSRDPPIQDLWRRERVQGHPKPVRRAPSATARSDRRRAGRRSPCGCRRLSRCGRLDLRPHAALANARTPRRRHHLDLGVDTLNDQDQGFRHPRSVPRRPSSSCGTSESSSTDQALAIVATRAARRSSAP